MGTMIFVRCEGGWRCRRGGVGDEELGDSVACREMPKHCTDAKHWQETP